MAPHEPARIEIRVCRRRSGPTNRRSPAPLEIDAVERPSRRRNARDSDDSPRGHTNGEDTHFAAVDVRSDAARRIDSKSRAAFGRARRLSASSTASAEDPRARGTIPRRPHGTAGCAPIVGSAACRVTARVRPRAPSAVGARHRRRDLGASGGDHSPGSPRFCRSTLIKPSTPPTHLLVNSSAVVVDDHTPPPSLRSLQPSAPLAGCSRSHRRNLLHDPPVRTSCPSPRAILTACTTSVLVCVSASISPYEQVLNARQLLLLSASPAPLRLAQRGHPLDRIGRSLSRHSRSRA